MSRLVTMLFLIALATPALSKDFVTHFEKSNYKATPRYDETITYCRDLAKASRWLHYTSFGTSPQGRELPLLIADGDKRFKPDHKKRDEKAVLLIQAGIHAGESDGKDAGLMLLRDIAVTEKYPELLDHVTVLFIPIFNVDGHERFGPYNRINQNGPEEMGWRVTAQGLNLNRDYLKIDAPEMQAWVRLYDEWDPDFFIDCHATDGADYQYVLTYLMEIYGNMDPTLTEWTKTAYLDRITDSMLEEGYDLFPYVYLIDWPNPRSGLRSWVSTPRFSTGYTALCNRPGLLIETHMLKDYKTRVLGTYTLLRETIEILNDEYGALRDAIALADAAVQTPQFRDDAYPLQFAPDSNGVQVDFKGVKYTSEESDLTGGTWYKFGDEPETFPITFLDKQNVTKSAQLPEAYIVPGEWHEVIARLKIHGVEMEALEDAQTHTVSSYRFENVQWQQTPFEGRHPVTFELSPIEEERSFPAGSVWVSMTQQKARLVAHMLEPDGPDSFLQWGFFDVIFEQKEYGESYVMEKMAREMLANDPDLKREFEEKKKNETQFAENPRWMLNWFYLRSPYGDDRINVYPIGKVMHSRNGNGGSR